MILRLTLSFASLFFVYAHKVSAAPYDRFSYENTKSTPKVLYQVEPTTWELIDKGWPGYGNGNHTYPRPPSGRGYFTKVELENVKSMKHKEKHTFFPKSWDFSEIKNQIEECVKDASLGVVQPDLIKSGKKVGHTCDSNGVKIKTNFVATKDEGAAGRRFWKLVDAFPIAGGVPIEKFFEIERQLTERAEAAEKIAADKAAAAKAAPEKAAAQKESPTLSPAPKDGPTQQKGTD